VAGTGAERARRHRRHVKGDHSLCSPEHCDLADDAPQPITVRDNATEGDAALPVILPRTERGPRGQQLWDDLSGSLPPAPRLMLDEACRIADRLDRLDHMLTDRDVWLSLITSETGDIRLVIDGLLAETRQQATALRGLLTEVVKAAPKALGRSAGSSSTSGQPKGAANVSSLAARAARRRASSG
jgi:hypothetical protein